jgi:hypothetical protein
MPTPFFFYPSPGFSVLSANETTFTSVAAATLSPWLSPENCQSLVNKNSDQPASKRRLHIQNAADCEMRLASNYVLQFVLSSHRTVRGQR